MKFTLATIAVLSALCGISQAANIKVISFLCKSIDQGKTCTQNLRAVAKRGSQGYYQEAGMYKGRAPGAIFDGECGDARAIIDKTPGCGQACSTQYQCKPANPYGIPKFDP